MDGKGNTEVMDENVHNAASILLDMMGAKEKAKTNTISAEPQDLKEDSPDAPDVIGKEDENVSPCGIDGLLQAETRNGGKSVENRTRQKVSIVSGRVGKDPRRQNHVKKKKIDGVRKYLVDSYRQDTDKQEKEKAKDDGGVPTVPVENRQELTAVHAKSPKERVRDNLGTVQDADEEGALVVGKHDGNKSRVDGEPQANDGTRNLKQDAERRTLTENNPQLAQVKEKLEEMIQGGMINSSMRCPCRKSVEEGFMICCDKCNFWVHGACIGIYSNEEASDEYFCPICVERSKRKLGKRCVKTTSIGGGVTKTGKLSGRRGGKKARGKGKKKGKKKETLVWTEEDKEFLIETVRDFKDQNEAHRNRLMVHHFQQAKRERNLTAVKRQIAQLRKEGRIPREPKGEKDHASVLSYTALRAALFK
eukprot:Plantae.Rhodophyta-Hildenbrandia_rubra.ctg19074.p1 GENE.Plantae.Rhodophyta-Hildenbrandia_rubra.ctg19074~~Plantae.Rhodophyta-Hildenbrandia_rubra.ctg19074.p1  ORF type:complete len:420 (-),score=92.11 Plantae.Rhodophyta-Hildenbrandia_rubra.ctg19074:236-1495(-)